MAIMAGATHPAVVDIMDMISLKKLPSIEPIGPKNNKVPRTPVSRVTIGMTKPFKISGIMRIRPFSTKDINTTPRNGGIICNCGNR